MSEWDAFPAVKGTEWDAFPPAADTAAAPDIGTGRAGLAVAARGIPVVGAYTDPGIAAFNAAAQPVTETGMSHKPTYAERYEENKALVKAAADAREREHPIESTIEKMGLGTAATVPLFMAAPVAMGVEGTLGGMALRGAASQAALGGADAAARGEDIGPAAVEGGVLGAATPLALRGAGKAIQAVRDYRAGPPPLVPANVERVGGADVPFHTTDDPAIEAQKEIMRKGASGAAAERIAKAADDEARARIGQATENIVNPMGLEPAAATDAGAAVREELSAQEAKRAADEAAQAARVEAQGQTVAQGLGGGTAAASPFEAAEGTGAAVTAARNAAVARTRAAYTARDAVPGVFDPSVPRGLAEDIRGRLNAGEDPIWVNPTNESTANKALKLIDQTIGKDSGLFENTAAPKAPPAPAAAAAAKPTEDETIAALRSKFGDGVADAYANQAGKKAGPLSLLQFIASKGGIAAHPELEAIGLGPGHRVQIPGQPGFFSAVKKNGMELDRMREAAEEAGYFRGHGEATSTPTEFLDAIDAEMRGQKRYPEGYEGHKTATEKAAMSAAEQHAYDALHRGLEDDLHAAGHGGLGPDVKKRAVELMRDEGMHPDEAVDHALMQLDQEDAARAAASAGPAPGGFPGDRPAAIAGRPVDLKIMDEARKRLVTMYGDAKSAAMRSGDRSDVRAMAKILHEFDNSIGDALSSGKFSGDAALAKDLQDKARASHAEYKDTFSAKPGDKIGRAIEQILGRYSDTAATAEDIQKLSYGSKSNPGTGNSVKVALRLKKILGENSPEFGRWKSGLFKYVDDRSLPAAERAQRIDEFLGTSLGRSGVLKPEERAAMAAYSRELRASAPSTEKLTDLQKDLRRISGADNNRMTVDEVTGKLLEKGSENLLLHLKDAAAKGTLQPETWDKIRRGILDHVLNAPEGHNAFTPLQMSKRLHGFLGTGKAKVLLSEGERKELSKLGGLHKRLVPIPGTINPSGTAWVGARLMKHALVTIMRSLGMATHGLVGAAVGHGLGMLGISLKDARAGQDAVRLFYGPQPKSATPKYPRLPAAIVQAAVPASQR